MVRILIADDHEIIREGLRRVLVARPGWIVCGEAATGREAVTLATELAPDVAVLDFAMPEMNGVEATRRIRAILPRIEVVILTMYESEQLAAEALRAGARGFVLKSDAGTMLIAAIEQVSLHHLFLTPRISPMVLEGFLQPDRGAGAESGGRLTTREQEIVKLVAEGSSSRAVAEALDISVKTVETHRVNLMRKLDLHSVSELVRYAIRNRIIEP